MYGEPRAKAPLNLEDIPKIDPETINKPLMRKVRTYLNKIGVGYPDPAYPGENRYRPLAFAHGLMEHGYMGYTGGATKYFRLPLIAAAQNLGAMHANI